MRPASLHMNKCNTYVNKCNTYVKAMVYACVRLVKYWNDRHAIKCYAAV